MITFKYPRDKIQFTNLAKQFMPRKCKCLLWVFEDSTKLPRSYLLLDRRPETDNILGVRARIFSDVNYPQVVYIPTLKKYKYMPCYKSFLIYVVTMRGSSWQAVC